MRIVHLCLGSFFPDNYSYQENMLPKFHKSQGHHVEVIASLQTFDADGKPSYMKKAETYQNEYDIKVIRREYRKPARLYHKLKRYKGTYSALVETRPDVLFIHGCQFMDMDKVVRYLKNNPCVRVYVDNHCDSSNSGTNWFSKNILHKFLWRRAANLINPFTTKFYGVLPVRVDWLINMYHLPEEKCELLVMGADDDKVDEALNDGWKERIRNQYGIKQDDFLLMTGGKIDSWKTQTLLLMEAVKRIDNPKIKLIVFGSVTPELKEEVNALTDGYKIQYIGWVRSEDSYKYWSACDLAVFPGRHSVFWEQVAGMGIPMVCKYWEGTTHVDMGGNVVFLQNDTTDEIERCLLRIINDEREYEIMKNAAIHGKKAFSYRDIAKRAIEV